jgi:hypothetical protein
MIPTLKIPEALMTRTKGLKGLLMAAGLGVAFVCSNAVAQTAGQDMHDAGHETKAATVDAAHGTAHGTEKAYHSTKRGTKKVAHKTAHGTKKAWHKTENFGDRVADKPQTH